MFAGGVSIVQVYKIVQVVLGADVTRKELWMVLWCGMSFELLKFGVCFSSHNSFQQRDLYFIILRNLKKFHFIPQNPETCCVCTL